LAKQSLEGDDLGLICKEKCQLASLLTMATFDDLTKVLNRKGILACLESEFRRVFRHKFPLSLLLIDLDYFKKINDSQGHIQGDLVLKESSRRMKEALRQEDYLGRYGGDEFLAVLPHTPFEGAMIVASRLVAEFSNAPIRNGETTVYQTVSVGVASHKAGDTLTSFLERADRVLYQSKSEGRSRCSGAVNG
jgi:diguanylate cyclase (GGDEF)-like protein